MPRRARNQVAAIFIAGGYTPASAAPHSARVISACENDGTTGSSRLIAAASSADIANSRRAATISARLSSADSAVPPTNPSCTAVVSHPTCALESDQRCCSSGATALPANHTLIPSNSAQATRSSMRQRSGASSS